jgi:hypothetical protein
VRYSRFGAPHEINLDSKLGIRLIGHTGPATVIYKGVEVPCTVAVTDTDIDVIVQGEKRECLYMTLQPRLQAATVHILNVEENSCPLSAGMQHKGAFLLGLAEELCRQVGVHTVSLEDSSYITTSEGLMIDLQFRSVMRHGASWYERQGYVYTCAFEGGRERAVGAVRDASVGEISKFLAALSNSHGEQVTVKTRWVEEYRAGVMSAFPEVEAQIGKPREELKARERVRVREFVAADTRYDAFFGNIASRVSLLLACLARYKKTSTSDKLFEFLEFVWAESRASFVEIASLIFPSLDLRHAADRTRQLLPPNTLPPFPHCAWMAKTVV